MTTTTTMPTDVKDADAKDAARDYARKELGHRGAEVIGLLDRGREAFVLVRTRRQDFGLVLVRNDAGRWAVIDETDAECFYRNGGATFVLSGGMSAPALRGGLAPLIVDATRCKLSDVAEVEDIMRHDIFHSTLDWQSRSQLQRAAVEAFAALPGLRKALAKVSR